MISKSFANLLFVCLLTYTSSIHLRTQAQTFLAQNQPNYALACPEDHPKGDDVACPEYYEPTCGWYSESVKCVTQPCGETFSNKCFACANTQVGYYSKGECSTAVEPVDPVKPDYGHAPEGATLCPAKRSKICTKELHYVCGWSKSEIKCLKYPCATTYSNPCMACADENVAAYTEGKCPVEIGDLHPIDPIPIDPSPKQILCPKDSKDPESLCLAVVDPVCGWFNDSIQCLVYPCAGNYSNSCEACKDSKVESYSLGKCPSIIIPPKPDYSHIPKDANYCKKSLDIAIMCTMDYRPVCGYLEKDVEPTTYSNGCVACSNRGVIAWTEGECEEKPDLGHGPADATVCEDLNGALVKCSNDYIPVCGWFKSEIACKKEPCAQTYTNQCQACHTNDIVASYTEGECPNYDIIVDDPEVDLGHAPDDATPCTLDPRLVRCSTEKIPVCGWFKSNIQCIDYPCAADYLNPCQACIDSNVAAYTEGECPDQPFPDDDLILRPTTDTDKGSDQDAEEC